MNTLYQEKIYEVEPYVADEGKWATRVRAANLVRRNISATS